MADDIAQSFLHLPYGENRFQLLVQAVTDYAIFMLDIDGGVASWNTGAERASGYVESDIIGSNFAVFFTAEERAIGKPKESLRIASASRRFEDEGWRVRKDGSRFWALANIDAIRSPEGLLVGFAMITRDMTERRAAVEALKESEQRIRLLVESVIDYAIIMLDPEGLITNWNSGAKLIKGYTAAEMIGRNFAVFYTEEDQLAGAPSHALATAAAEGRFKDQGWRVRKDGSRLYASVVIDAVHDEGGKLIGFAKVTRDLTETRALECANEQLYQAQKLETVGQLTGGVAHDFNNLLTIVTGCHGLISNVTSDEKVLRLLAKAEHAVARGAKLTAQLLAFSRKQTLKPQTSNINDLIGVFETLLDRAVGETVELKLDFDLLLQSADIDPAQFQSALLNLVVNARDAMPAGGTLTIETRNVEIAAGHTALAEVKPGSYVMVAVRDTGKGMMPEVKSRAIEPFYTTKDVGKGSGLGLSQVYGFARQSDGQIEIESELDVGTIVRMYLPRTPGSGADGADAAAVLGSSKTILVVEDDPEVLEITVETLRKFGYVIYSARSAPDALVVLQRDVPIDLLFTDIIMPDGMNGIELAQEARLMRPNLPVLLASGYPQAALQQHEDGFGDLEFIAKPYRLTDLASRLQSLVQMPGKAGRMSLPPTILDISGAFISFEQIAHSANDIVIVTEASLDPPGPKILYVNPAFTRLSGYSAEEVIGLSPRILQGPGTSRAALDKIAAALKAGRAVHQKVLNYAKSGAPYWLDLRIVPLLDKGRIVQFVAIERDVTLDKRRLDELECVSERDVLTGIPNRRALLRTMDAELQAARSRGGTGPCLAYISVDHFKQVSDRFGQATGDAVLLGIADRVAENVRRVDTVGRLGGEEFAACMPAITLQAAAAIGERLRQAVAAEPFATPTGPLHITVSVGVSEAGRNEQSLPDLMARADRGMYLAKQSGRDRVVTELAL